MNAKVLFEIRIENALSNVDVSLSRKVNVDQMRLGPVRLPICVCAAISQLLYAISRFCR